MLFFNLITGFLTYIFVAIGWWKLFGKCGIKKGWALIPVARNYFIALSADRKDEGIVWLFTSFMSDFFLLIYYLMKGINLDINFTSIYIAFILGYTFAVVNFVYEVKIYYGLCEMFNKKKRWFWIILWLFFGWLPALIWGFSKKTQPRRRYGERKSQAAAESGETAEILDQGLTINITDSTVHEFLKKHVLLKDIHMNIKPGRMVLLLGGSGAGKTTFVNAVTGYEKAHASIHLDGNDLYTDFNRMKYEVGFVPQMDLIRYQDTVYNTLMDAARLRMPANTSHKARKKRVQEVMDIFGLTPVKNNIVGKQSGGQKKRISIASEFISDPSLYILDEPDSGLDGILAKDLMRRLHDISREGKIVIVITHTPDRVLQYFDDVIVLAKDHDHIGRLVYYGTIEDAKTFFERDTMEEIVKTINRTEEGGDGRADELIEKFGGGANGTA